MDIFFERFVNKPDFQFNSAALQLLCNAGLLNNTFVYQKWMDVLAPFCVFVYVKA